MICPLQTAAHHLYPHPPIKSQSEPEVSRLAFHAPEWGCNALTDEKRAPAVRSRLPGRCGATHYGRPAFSKLCR